MKTRIYGKFSVEIAEFLRRQAQEDGWLDYDWSSENDMFIEMLQSFKEVSSEKVADRRWWYDIQTVVEVGDRFISYPDARSTRDMSARDSGWMMNLDAVCFVKPEEKTVVVYVPI